MSATTPPELLCRNVDLGHRCLHVGELGAGYPLVLLHGGGPGASGASNFARNVEALARRFRVLVPDLPGYGASSKGVDRADPFGDLAGALLQMLDALGIPQAHLVGNSLGGACALRAALEQPARVSALVLMGPGGIGTTRALPTTGLRKLLGYYAGSGPSREKLCEFVRDYLVHDGSAVPEALIEQRYLASIDPEVVQAPPLRGPANLATALRMDLTRDRRLRHCTVPTLVLWGTHDRVNRPSGGATLQSLMPRCDLHLFSHTGHWVQWERAEEFNALTAAFLSVHTPANA
jgi:4,5:9,10-diseco-3-hydroxy-5,9,17-trioxoandrosta-1(10),2-diene-4-oate hydrolase